MDYCLQVAWIAGTKAIAEQSNFMFSPLGLRAGLALLATGADGQTLRQLLAFLGSEHIHQLNAASARILAEMRVWPQLSFAAGIFVDRSLRLRPEFQSTAAAAHGAFTRSVDFQNQADAAVAEVNRFISQATNGRLNNIISPGTFVRSTKCVLANAMHFKATWGQKFESYNTQHRTFHRQDGTRVTVPFLSDPGTHYAARFDGLGFKVLQLFYKMVGHDGQVHFVAPCFCMLVFLPIKRDGLRDVLRMAVTEPDFVMRCVPRSEQDVSPCMVPKFKFSSELDAGGALAQLGLGAPFDPLAADLSRMAVNTTPEGLYVSAMRQKCAVEVDEEGTTAVEATYSCSSPAYGGPEPPRPPPMSFVAEHPFMFAIVEYEKAQVLFLGHVLFKSHVTWIAGSDAITEQSNFIFSPMCLRAGLALLTTGADGETLRQMLAFLGSEHIHQLNATSAGLLADMQAWPQLSFAASIFLDRSLRLRPDFESTAAAAHGAFTRSVDFRNQADAVAAEVNGFISQATNGRLTNVISPGTLKSDTMCVLANAMHFKAKWARMFESWNTKQAMFHRLDDTRVRVPFLSDPGMHYAAKFEFKVLQLFYKMVGHNGQFDFGAPCFCRLVFLPIKRDGLRDVLRMVVTEPDVRHAIVTPCKVPKFKFSSQVDAGGALAQLGLGAPFGPDTADLSGWP
uniref:Serpin domain-containing protein n=1 Tax=Oryza punctata TaxID=4537 RepID=A0A0E0KT79_ORYPU